MRFICRVVFLYDYSLEFGGAHWASVARHLRGARVRTQRQEHFERGCDGPRVIAGFVLRARGAAARADPRDTTTLYVVELGPALGESGARRPRGARQDAPTRTLGARLRLAAGSARFGF